MLARIRSLRIRTQFLLLGSIIVCGFLSFSIISFATLNKLKINGQVYTDIILGKDLIADILPPPEYILESYLVVLQAAQENVPEKQHELEERFKHLHKEFDERHEYWKQNLSDGQMKDLMVVKSYEPANSFYGKVEKDFFPAVFSREQNAVQAVRKDIELLYEKHRLIIDELVKVAEQSNAANEVLAATLIRRRTLILITVGLLTILSAVIASIFFSHSITSPLKEAVGISEQLAEGNLAVTIQSNGNNEAGQLFSSMSTMLLSLRSVVAEVKTSATTVASSSQQLSTSSELMHRNLVDQAGRATQISTSATEMSQTVTDIAKNTSSIAVAATDTSRIARDGEEVVARSVHEVKAIANTVTSTSQMITSLGERSKHIGEIVNVIKEIADQTNLLALNAAIEAARAGEQGRGFAVVADEVRKLAERTAKATSEIGEMINAIQGDVDAAVLSMGETTKSVATGVKDVTEAGVSFNRIVESVNALQTMAEQIAAATEEMSSVAEMMTEDIEAIAGATNKTSSDSSQISQASSALAQLSHSLQQSVGHFKLQQDQNCDV